MTGMKDHICSSTCMFCRVLDNPQRIRQTQSMPAVDSQVVERIKELEQRTMLSSTQTNLTTAKGEDLERLALLDSLTELYNSRTFLKELQDELRRAKRYKRPVSLCLLAIDGFRNIAREYGALTSDAVLKGIADVISSCVRDVDIPARYSAEELAIILPETNAAGAAIVAERIRQKVASQNISHNWHNLKATASIGLAAFPAHAREYNELIARAVQALELAVQRGGDRALTV